MGCSTPGFPVLHYLPELSQTHVHGVCDAIQPSYPLSPLLLLPASPPSIRVFSSELALHIMWPEYWSFSFLLGPSSEYSGLISFRTDWFVEKEMATHSSILAWKNPWIEESGGLKSMGLHD